MACARYHAKLPPTWQGVVFYSGLNRALVTTGLRAWEASGRLILTPFPGPAGNATDPASFSRNFANAMLLDAAFYRALPFDKFLAMQARLKSIGEDAWKPRCSLARSCLC